MAKVGPRGQWECQPAGYLLGQMKDGFLDGFRQEVLDRDAWWGEVKKVGRTISRLVECTRIHTQLHAQALGRCTGFVCIDADAQASSRTIWNHRTCRLPHLAAISIVDHMCTRLR